MGCGVDRNTSVPGGAEHGDLLVLGYQGTLIPDPDRADSPSPGPRDASAAVHEFSLEPWVALALRELDLRIPAGQRPCGREPVELGPLTDGLRHRLSGMVTQVLLACPDAGAEVIARDFSVLSRLLNVAVAEWIDGIAVFFERLRRDAAPLAAWLHCETLPGLQSLTAASSDSHTGGHKVLRLLFCDGRSVYYKPRPVTGEWLWEQLIHSVNAHSSLQLSAAGALAGQGGRYGWVSSLIPHGALSNWDQRSDQARAYWHAAGATLCLAEHVRMTDLHMANVMATACGPGLFDAESLGNPPSSVSERAKSGAPAPFTAAIDDLLDTGLLPLRNSGGLPDTSGLFGRRAAAPQILVPRWSSGSDGRRRLDLSPAVLLDHGNAPPGATPVEVLPHLVSGYREAAMALMRCRESLVSPRSRWRSTLEHSHAPRVVLRDTLEYGLLLSRSLRPEQLQSAQRRHTALESALRASARRALPAAVLRTELRTLLHLHIPRFTVLPGSRTVAAGSGRPLAPRYYSCSPSEAVLRRLGALSPERLDEIQAPALLMAVLGQRL